MSLTSCWHGPRRLPAASMDDWPPVYSPTAGGTYTKTAGTWVILLSVGTFRHRRTSFHHGGFIADIPIRASIVCGCVCVCLCMCMCLLTGNLDRQVFSVSMDMKVILGRKGNHVCLHNCIKASELECTLKNRRNRLEFKQPSFWSRLGTGNWSHSITRSPLL
jgi:hypothetical protein